MREKRGVAIILTLLLSIMIFSFMGLGVFSHLSNKMQQGHFVNQLQELYELEAAKAACLWEENHASPPMAWSTLTSSTTKLEGSSVGADNFYRLSGFNFRAQVLYNAGTITIYTHAYKGTEASPQDSQYAEYIYTTNSPLYQYVLFKNQNLNFPFTSAGGTIYLLHCDGGKIHSNGYISFNSSSIRFDGVKELSCAGTMQYPRGSYYPAPNVVDNWDGAIDGMAPAPYAPANPSGSVHDYTTDGTNVIPGPYKYWYDPFRTTYKTYGNYIGGSWSKAPAAWSGEESYFYGRQYIDTSSQPTSYYLTRDGQIVTNASQAVDLHRFYLADLTGNSLTTSTAKRAYYSDDVYLRPYQDSQGNANNDWYEIPGALPESYTWRNKYAYSRPSEVPVTFYATQACTEGSAGCNFVAHPQDPTYNTGWRYIKKDILGAPCTTDACYAEPASTYIQAQDYTAPDGRSYFDSRHIDPPNYNKNNEFFTDYTYGQDANDLSSPFRQIRALNTQYQSAGVAQYQELLAQNRMDQVIQPGIDRKEILLGNLFDNGRINSPYKLKAQQNGIYIDQSNVDTIIASLNSGGEEVAREVTYYHWLTTRPITLVDIDVEKMQQQDKTPANGMIYVKGIPIRLSNAKNLPGVNSADGRKGVFTVISEESVYLKGDYNYEPTDPNDTQENWKVSHIATKKQIFTLSDAFSDPAQPPDLAIYRHYPYVYVKKVSGQYVQEEGDPASGDGGWVVRGSSDPYVPADVKTWVNNTVAAKQVAHEATNPVTPNRVDKSTYNYNSLFITPYTLNASLESWYYLDAAGQERQASKNVTGSLLDLYANDPAHPEYLNYKANLTAEESGTSSRGWLSPSATSYISSYGARKNGSAPASAFSYDARLPNTSTNNPNATLGVTGGSGVNLNFWRLISSNYFESKTGT